MVSYLHLNVEKGFDIQLVDKGEGEDAKSLDHGGRHTQEGGSKGLIPSFSPLVWNSCARGHGSNASEHGR